MRNCSVRQLGRVDYGRALELQQQAAADRKLGLVPDQLLLLEHPHVITLGVRGDGGRSHIVASPDVLASRGVQVHETGRGGDVTYHGPGQIVGYTIFKLPPERQDVRRYVRDVEEAMIRACADYGVAADRIPQWTGVWIGDEHSPNARKIAAIGVHIARWQTSHGFAFNVSTDLDHFKLIVPCGISDRGVTSLERARGRSVPLREVEDAFIRHFAAVFGRDLATPARTSVA
jgi:lipoyl(octanoyl) transferase